MQHTVQSDLYNAEAEAFDAFAASSPTWTYVEAPAFRRLLLPFIHESAKLLDAGCGTGRLTRWLVECGLNPANVTGVDVSEKMLSIACAKLPGATFKEQDVRHLDLPGGYDLVTANMLFECFDNEQLFLAIAKLREQLKSGSRLVYVVTHPLRNFEPGFDYLKRRWMSVTAPWGSRLTDYHRPLSDFVDITHAARFHIDTMEELALPLDDVDQQTRERYMKCPAVRLAIRAMAV